MQPTAPATLAVTVALVLGSAVLAQGIESDPRSQFAAVPTSLEETAARFLPGYELLTSVGTIVLEHGATHAFTFETTPGLCYGAIGFSSEVTDLDLRFRSEGDVIAQDVRPDAYPVVEWCAELATTVRVQLRSFVGAGTVDYGLYVDRNEAARTRGEQDQLTNRLTTLAATAVPRWAPAGPQWRSRFARPDIQEFRVESPLPDQCYAVIAAGQGSVVDVDLRFLDEEARELARDLVDDAEPMVAHCPSRPGALVVQVAVPEARAPWPPRSSPIPVRSDPCSA